MSTVTFTHYTQTAGFLQHHFDTALNHGRKRMDLCNPYICIAADSASRVPHMCRIPVTICSHFFDIIRTYKEFEKVLTDKISSEVFEMLKHKVTLLILASALTVASVMPAFASSRYYAAGHHEWDYYDNGDDDDGDDWYDDDGYNVSGEADHARSAELDALETEWAINSKTGNDSLSSGNYNDYYYYSYYSYDSGSRYDSDDYFFFDGGPGYTESDPVEGSYSRLSNSSAPQLGWNLDSTGWYYMRADYTYPKNQWESINGKWYYFDDNGYMQVGWLQYNGSLYYLDADGAMLSDTVTPDGYRFDASGRLVGLPE